MCARDESLNSMALVLLTGLVLACNHSGSWKHWNPSVPLHPPHRMLLEVSRLPGAVPTASRFPTAALPRRTR